MDFAQHYSKLGLRRKNAVMEILPSTPCPFLIAKESWVQVAFFTCTSKAASLVPDVKVFTHWFWNFRKFISRRNAMCFLFAPNRRCCFTTPGIKALKIPHTFFALLMLFVLMFLLLSQKVTLVVRHAYSVKVSGLYANSDYNNRYKFKTRTRQDFFTCFDNHVITRAANYCLDLNHLFIHRPFCCCFFQKHAMGSNALRNRNA